MLFELQQKKGKPRSTKTYVPVWVSCIITLAAPKTAPCSSVFISERDLNSGTRCETFWKVFIKVLRYFPPSPPLPITPFFFPFLLSKPCHRRLRSRITVTASFFQSTAISRVADIVFAKTEAGKGLNFAKLRSSCDGPRTDWSVQHTAASSTPPVPWCLQQMLSSHKKSCLRLVLAAWLHGMSMASQSIREAEGRRAACYERLQWNPLSIFAEPKVLGCQAFVGGRWATGTQEMPEKVNGQVPSTKVSCQAKACGLVSSRKGGSREILEGGTVRREWSRSVVALVSPAFPSQEACVHRL